MTLAPHVTQRNGHDGPDWVRITTGAAAMGSSTTNRESRGTSAPIATLTRVSGALVAVAPDPCDRCEDEACALGSCPTYAAGDDPANFGDFDEDYRAWGPEP